MDEQVFLAPASRSSSGNRAYQHFEKTVLKGVSRQLCSQYSSEIQIDPVRVWGLKSSIKTAWEEIQVGDWLLFYTDSDTYRFGAQVLDTEFNPELGDAIRSDILDLHGSEEGSDWDCLVYLDDPVEINASGKEIANIFDYGNNFPVRFIRVTAERMDKLENEFDSVTSFVNSLRTHE